MPVATFHVPDRTPLVDPRTGMISDDWRRFFQELNNLLTFAHIGGAISLAQLVAHAATHGPAAADALKLDDLATPDDNTDLNATTGRHGLLPKLSGNAAQALRGDGTWA